MILQVKFSILADLKEGEKGYALPWAIQKKDDEIEISSSAYISSEIYCGYSLLVKRVKDGVNLVSIDKDCNRQLKQVISSNTLTIGMESHIHLPVLDIQWSDIEYIPRNWANEEYVDNKGMPNYS